MDEEGTTATARHNNIDANADADSENNNYASDQESEGSCLSNLERWATSNHSTNKISTNTKRSLLKGSYAAKVTGTSFTTPLPRAGGTGIFDNIDAQRGANL